MQQDTKQAEELVLRAFELVGEHGLRAIIMRLGTAQLTMAIQNVFSDQRWVELLYSAVSEPQHAQIQWLCKLMDKFLPSPQATKTLSETPDQFIVMYEQPPGAVDSE